MEISPWSKFKLHPTLESQLEKNGLKTPTDVQSQVLFYTNYAVDCIVASKTGSGKTLCYVLPMLSSILREEVLEDRIQGLVLVPTRELAIQVYREYKKMLNEENTKKCRISLIIGGLSKDKQLRILNKRPHVIVATVGR